MLCNALIEVNVIGYYMLYGLGLYRSIFLTLIEKQVTGYIRIRLQFIET